jgi:hypothetical protein
VSRDILEKIIGRAAMDPDFRRMIIEDPREAFKDYNLTHEQIAAIRSIPPDALEKFAYKLMKGAESNSNKS